MTPYEIPLTPEAQRFSIALGGTTYAMRLYWCPPSDCWALDISDAFGAPILQGLPVVTGADLLAQHASAGIAGGLVVFTEGDADRAPGYADLGDPSHLYFVATP